MVKKIIKMFNHNNNNYEDDNQIINTKTKQNKKDLFSFFQDFLK